MVGVVGRALFMVYSTAPAFQSTDMQGDLGASLQNSVELRKVVRWLRLTCIMTADLTNLHLIPKVGTVEHA